MMVEPTDSTKISRQKAGPKDAYIELFKQVLTASLYDESAWQIVITSPVAVSAPALISAKPGIGRRWKMAMAALSGKDIAPINIVTADPMPKDTLAVKKTPFDASVRDEGRDWPLFGYTMIGPSGSITFNPVSRMYWPKAFQAI